MNDLIRTAIGNGLLRATHGLVQIATSLAEGRLDQGQVQRLKARLAEACAGQSAHPLQGEEPDFDDVDPDAFELLTDLGVETLVAERLAAQCPFEEIEDWVSYARMCKGLTNPAGLVVSRLRRGVLAPKVPVADGSRYVSGEFAAYIQH